MLSIELLHLLKREFREIYSPNTSGRFKSAIGALELIERFKEEVENETIQKIKEVDSRKPEVSGKYENTKNTLVK